VETAELAAAERVEAQVVSTRETASGFLRKAWEVRAEVAEPADAAVAVD
jgi:hypothetical protein